MSRYRKRIVFCGATGTRKSTAVKKIIAELYEPKKERVIIYDPQAQDTWYHLAKISLDQVARMQTGVYRICDCAPDEFFTTIDQEWRKTKQYGGAVICEDASRFLTPHRNQHIYDILCGLRHINCDWYGITHTIQETPGYIIRQLNEFVFFKTGDNWKMVADRFPGQLQPMAEKLFYDVNDPARVDWYRRALTIIKTGSQTFGT